MLQCVVSMTAHAGVSREHEIKTAAIVKSLFAIPIRAPIYDNFENTYMYI